MTLSLWNSVNPACTAGPNNLGHVSNILPHPYV